MVGFPWSAYGVSQAAYYRKAMKENTKDGIKYETVMAKIDEEIEFCDEPEECECEE